MPKNNNTSTPLWESTKEIITTATQRTWEAAVWVGEEIYSTSLSAFNKRNVAVLGDTESGKTTLQWWLRTGKTYTVYDGKRMGPTRTMGVFDAQGMTAVPEVSVLERMVDQYRRVKINGGICFLPRDVGGEYREEWRKMLGNQHPELLIYLVDGRAEYEQDIHDEHGQRVPSLHSVADTLCRDVIAPYLELGAWPMQIAILLNYSDVWNPANEIARFKAKQGLLQAEIANTLVTKELHSRFDMNMLSYYWIQLSPERNQWTEVEAAFKSIARNMGWSKA